MFQFIIKPKIRRCIATGKTGFLLEAATCYPTKPEQDLKERVAYAKIFIHNLALKNDLDSIIQKDWCDMSSGLFDLNFLTDKKTPTWHHFLYGLVDEQSLLLSTFCWLYGLGYIESDQFTSHWQLKVTQEPLIAFANQIFLTHKKENDISDSKGRSIEKQTFLQGVKRQWLIDELYNNPKTRKYVLRHNSMMDYFSFIAQYPGRIY